MKRVLIIALFFVSLHSIAQNTFVGVNKFNDTIYYFKNLVSGSSSDSVLVKTAGTNGYLALVARSALGGSITADNGLTANTSTNVQLGGTLTKLTQINTAGFSLISSSTSSNYGLRLLDDGTGLGLNINVHSFPINSTTAVMSPVLFQVTDNTYTSTVPSLLQVLNNPSNSVSNGIGSEVEFGMKTSTTASRISNQLISKWTDVTDATRTSQFYITGVSNGTTQTILILKGSGIMNFPVMPPTYADNASAIAGGLVTGDVYMTSTGHLMIVYAP